ncbi:Trafficking protein particle complex subunit 13 [Schistosoma japonicum]|nr:Trafficking protein particle complex subunit 13 [Schistosoma japonicum]
MRLNRPTFVIQRCEPAELYLDDIAGCLTAADASIRGDLDGIALNLLPTGNSPNRDNNINNEKENYDCIQPKVGGYSELLSLTHSFGTIYLGETFSAYINLHNESKQICYNVELKVALHNRIELITLPVSTSISGQPGSAVTRNSSTNSESSTIRASSNQSNNTSVSVNQNVFDLHPGQSLNAIISHELKELGVHNLRCTVSYFQTNSHSKPESSSHVAAYESPRLTSSLSSRDTPKREPITFQRLYKFTVNKPLDVRKKFSLVDIDHSLLMETQIQNLTTTPIMLERVLFESNPQFNVIDLNNLQFHKKSSFNTSGYYLQPNDVQQFLYRLVPTTTNSLSLLNSSTTSSIPTPPLSNPVQVSSTTTHQLSISAGRLDITWRSLMGEKGRLQTSSLKYELPTIGDIQVKVSSLPPTVTTERPFTLKFELTNCSKMNLDLILSLHSAKHKVHSSPIQINPLNNENEISSDFDNCIQLTNSSNYLPPIVWLSRTRQKLGKVLPGQCIPFELNLMATLPGLHMISGLYIHELTMNRDYEFNDLAHVLVFNNVPVPD